jgi:hypothetical protein
MGIATSYLYHKLPKTVLRRSDLRYDSACFDFNVFS